MLRCLRGSVPESAPGRAFISPAGSGGPIHPGPSPHATAGQCRELGRRVSLLWSVLTNQPGKEIEDVWGRKAEDLSDIFQSACFLQYATAVAYADCAAFACAGAARGNPVEPWSGGPEILHAIEALHGCLIRQIFTWPGIPDPDAGDERPDFA